MKQSQPETSPKIAVGGESKPRTKKQAFFFSFVWLALLLVALDLGTKWAVVNAFHGIQGSSYEVIPHFFYITLSYNTGSSFGLGSNQGWARYVFIVISWAASVAIAYYWHKHLKQHDAWIDAVFALCFAGAVGNAIDRTFYWVPTTGFNGVVDFLQFYVFGYDKESFAIFNVADSCLTLGIALLIAVEIVRAFQGKKEGER
jgi:signal peptidase II